MRKKKSYVENLKDTILETGFPLELEIDELLRQGHWGTFPSHHYVDDEEGISREIDEYALFPFNRDLEKSFEPLAVSPHLLVECKRWKEISAVILRKNLGVVTVYDFSGQTYNFPWLIDQKLPTDRIDKEFDLGLFLSKTPLHYQNFKNRIGVGIGMKPGDTKENSGREFRTGIMQLIKAQAYDVDISIVRDKTIRHTHYPFYFGFLCLLVEGKIFEVDRRGSDIQLEEVDHGVVKTSYKPKYSSEILSYLVDVVRRDAFESYLKVLQEDMRLLTNAIHGDKDRLASYLLRPPHQPQAVGNQISAPDLSG